MKTFHALAEQIKGWRQRSHPRNFLMPSRNATEPENANRGLSVRKQALLPPSPPPRHPSKIPAPVMAVLAVVSLTSAIGYRFYNQPQLKENTTAPKTIAADRDALVEDSQITETKRKDAQTGVVPVLKVDRTIDTNIYEQLENLWREIDLIRELAGSVPFVNEDVLSVDLQQFLRAASDRQWSAIAAAARRGNPSPGEPIPAIPPVLSDSLDSIRALSQLQNYQQQTGPSQLEDLLARIERARQNFQTASATLETSEENKLTTADKREFLALSDETWQTVKEAMQQTLERILAQGIPQGLPEEIQQEAIRIQLRSEISEPQLDLVARALAATIEPNLIEDRDETKRRAEQAAREVAPEVYEVRKGEIIVRAGEPIARREFVLLDELGLSRRGINWQGVGGTAVLVGGAIAIFLVVQRRTNVRLRCRDRLLLCLLSLSTPLLVQLNIKQVNLSAVGLLASSFYSPTLAATQVVLLGGLTGFGALAVQDGTPAGWEYLIPSAIGGLVAAIVAGRLRCREDLALLGGVVGLTQGGVNLIVTLIISSTPGTIWAVALPGAAICGLWGLAWCIVALGISPYLEKVFDLATSIRLAELSNPNRPLLKRLATEAPGTFQHTLFVASLAEAAARELHANIELVRAGTLYHDIGKMHDPLGFIENQMGGPNKHDEINDPWKSSRIIQKHVSEGLVMARRYNLPQAICNFIPEHQGTILISYFYFQAQQRAQEEGKTVLEEDFRYDGPIPQSRETGIVMLADACEAALRSLKDVTPEVAIATVKKIFTARWRDNQLMESGLKLEELPVIAEVFVRVWQQYNHQRIAYPKAALEKQPSAVISKQ
ncbi:MAG: HDIG domain-containing protein [Cyanobacteriota bacterium]|nr:HDIG domain-containing protein [Cyanobacteriota bacterium]